MEPARKIRAHWLTRKPDSSAYTVATLSVFGLILGTFVYWTDFLNAKSWMTAIPQNVFQLHEYWRPWTALFAHSDPVHLLSNSLLFFAFAYLLYGHFGSRVFPLAALFFGGITNIIVLTTLPSDANLLGASGVVYWMGAAWLTLYLFLESRDKISRRALKALGVGVMLFVPETFHANISYLSHVVGFLLGVLWAMRYYYANKEKFLHAEVIEYVIEES